MNGDMEKFLVCGYTLNDDSSLVDLRCHSCGGKVDEWDEGVSLSNLIAAAEAHHCKVLP